ncbi:glyoxalase [Burkholderia cepacia]|uniref:Glyoxalase n=3 Tax=Burkholderia cepacia TaxID=292 RepID=A0ABN5CVN7_BURCE|nr:glyoxalase [Burkholderia cepacia]AIO23219.1 glyoxalase-like domain protein [Burkholderia cepacia ATCC 25416]ALK18259.1 glyoxalase [Burkholderia cepacia ATCC 25416]ASE96266.1 glyoxalase [Burkholderia cepacia]ATF78731.1 glyoxalase [Burkholderia cepacia]MCA8466714.1 glyoxalase [Burkholderia cepacia]
MKSIRSALLALAIAAGLVAAPAAYAKPPVLPAATPTLAVGPQYDTAHVYVAPEDFDRFTDSFVATFGGSKSKQGVFQVTPTPSQTMSQLVFTPAGTISVFGFKTPTPWPFGAERTGYLVTDMDAAMKVAREHGAEVIVDTFPDPIGRDAVIAWTGGVKMQLYWHTQAPKYDALQTIPENRVYVSPQSVRKFVHDFVKFSNGKVLSDDLKAPGVEIGRPNDTYRRIRITSGFGKMTVLVTDGHLPYPYGHETTGYEVPDLAATLEKARAAGVDVLVPPYTADGRDAALVRFPGGYVAEIHAGAAR